MTLHIGLLVFLTACLIGSLPVWNHSRRWGYFPSGGIALTLAIVVVLTLSGRI